MNKKGFTLIELLAVVLIIGILAAIALPQYFKAVERARASEALSLFGTISGAQQRYFLQHDGYATNYSDLDIDFIDSTTGQAPAAGTLNTASFAIVLDNTDGSVTATRSSGGRFGAYTLKREISGNIICTKDGDKDVCPVLGMTSAS